MHQYLFSLSWSQTTASGWFVLNCAVSVTSCGIFNRLSVSVLVIYSSDGNRTSCSLSPDTSDTVNSMVRFSVIYSSFFPLFFIFSPNNSPLWKMLLISSKKHFLFLRYSNFCNFSSSFPYFPVSEGQIKVENLCHILCYLQKLKMGLRLASDAHFLPDFSIKMFLTEYSINW